MLFSSSVRVRNKIRIKFSVWLVRIRFSVWLVSCYAHVFVLVSIVIVTLPCHSAVIFRSTYLLTYSVIVMVVCFLCSEAERAGSSTRQAQEGRTGRVAVGRRRRTGTSSRRRGDASARTRRGSEALARGTAQEVSGRTRR